MEEIIIPSVGFNLAFIIVTVCLTELVKKFWKWKTIYPFLPVVFGVILGFLQAFIEVGFVTNFVETMLKNSFVIIGGAISSYDIIVKKIKNYIKKMKGNDERDSEIDRQNKID